MNLALLALALVAGAVWGAVAVVRLRRRHYLAANRPKVIKESLARAKAKQSAHPPRTNRRGPPPAGLR